MVHSRGRLTPGVSFTPGVFPVLGDLPEMYPVLADLLPGIAVTRKDTCKLYLMFQANDKWKKFFYFLTQSMHKLKIPFLAAFFSTPVLMHGGLIRGCQKKTFREFFQRSTGLSFDLGLLWPKKILVAEKWYFPLRNHNWKWREITENQLIFEGHSVKEDIIGRGQIFGGRLLGLRGMGICLIAGKFRKEVFLTHPRAHMLRFLSVRCHLTITCHLTKTHIWICQYTMRLMTNPRATLSEMFPRV